MSLLDIPLDKIAEADLNNLISTGVPESPTIDYKRDTYGNSESDKREFLADVSSFANTIGGDIVIGLDEASGLPTAVKPLTGDIDAEVRRLESIALSGIEPRLSNLRIRLVLVAGGHAIIVRVPRSFVPPHRVIAQNSNRFYARAGTKKYEPNVDQLRHLFTDAPHMLERIRSFWADRLVKITAGDTPTPLGQLGKVVLHVIPLPSFADGRMADIVSQLAKGSHVPLPLDEVGFPSNYAVNLDGYLSYSVGPTGGSPILCAIFSKWSNRGRRRVKKRRQREFAFHNQRPHKSRRGDHLGRRLRQRRRPRRKTALERDRVELGQDDRYRTSSYCVRDAAIIWAARAARALRGAQFLNFSS